MMIKKLITVIACLAMVSAGIAQEKSNGRKKITIGAKTGLNVSSIVVTNSKDSKTNPKAGFHIGVVSEFKASNGFAFAPEILFSTQGCRTNVIADGGIIEGSININYISIPLIARFYIVDCLSLDVVPQVGFATGMKIKGNKKSEKVDSKYYNVCDFSGGLGVTYNLDHKFFASVRYNISFSDVIKDFNNTNTILQLSVGYNFLSL